MTGRIGADTTLLIDFFRGEKNAIRFMEQHAPYLIVSELVVYEFLCGKLSPRDRSRFLQAMQSFPSAPVDREAVVAASKVYREGRKKGKPIGHQDALIAGSYKACGIEKIATRNAKHFPGMAMKY